MSAGDCFSLALDDNHIVYSCGKGNFGRLGHGDQLDGNQMKAINYLSNKVVIDIEAGARHSMALVSGKNPEVYTWGFGNY